MITFSIVTITFNAEQVLSNTLDSVLHQTYKHVEHLIIDGASTDSTVSLATAYKEKNDEEDNGHVVCIQSEPDKGLYDAMNKGLQKATGDYVLFLNAGDSFPNSYTLEQVIRNGELDNTPSDRWPAVLYGNTDIVDGSGKFLAHRHLQPPAHLSWRSFMRGMLVCHQAFYARLDIARNIPYNLKYRYSADVDWCIRVMLEGEKRKLPMKNLQTVVVNYLQEGQTTQHHTDSLKERYVVMQHHYGSFLTLMMHGWFVVRAVFRKLFFIVLLSALSLTAGAQTLLGGDLSMLPSYEKAGVQYRDSAGDSIEVLPFLQEQGWNTVRVRLFVNPSHASVDHQSEGVCQNLKYIIPLCQRIQRSGFQLMLDFHYSDTWADPGQQTMPKAWAHLSSAQLPDTLYQYTRNSLLALREATVVPDFIQVGNEITNGMCWPIAKIQPTEDKNWDVFTQLLQKGVQACREICPQAKVIIHTEKAGDWNATKSYYQRLAKYGVDYDIIGLSYYPMWHGTIPHLGQVLDSLQAVFPAKPVMVVETAAYYSHENDKWTKESTYSEFYPITTAGQTRFARELISELNKHNNLTGLFWWYPEENAAGNKISSVWLNRGLFDNHTGCAKPALYELSKIKE